MGTIAFWETNAVWRAGVGALLLLTTTLFIGIPLANQFGGPGPMPQEWTVPLEAERDNLQQQIDTLNQQTANLDSIDPANDAIFDRIRVLKNQRNDVRCKIRDIDDSQVDNSRTFYLVCFGALWVLYGWTPFLCFIWLGPRLGAYWTVVLYFAFYFAIMRLMGYSWSGAMHILTQWLHL